MRRRWCLSPLGSVGGTLLGVLCLGALLAPWLTPYDPRRQVLTEGLHAPSW